MINTMKCLDCGNTSKFVVPYIDRTLTTFNEQGDIVDEHSISYWSYDDERITCASDDCGSDNLNIYEEQ